MRVSIDRYACMRSGFCQRIAPQVFRLDELEQVSVVLHELVPPESEDAAQEAANACPASAIEVRDE